MPQRLASLTSFISCSFQGYMKWMGNDSISLSYSQNNTAGACYYLKEKKERPKNLDRFPGL